MNKKLKINAPILALILCLITVTIVLANNPDGADFAVNRGAGLVEAAELQAAIDINAAPAPQDVERAEAACSGGTAPAVEGITLTECYQRNFTVGGNPRTIRVWYTTDTSTYTVDSVNYVHGISGTPRPQMSPTPCKKAGKLFLPTVPLADTRPMNHILMAAVRF